MILMKGKTADEKQNTHNIALCTASYSVLSFWNNWIYVFVEHPLFISVVDWILIIIMICLDKHKKVR